MPGHHVRHPEIRTQRTSSRAARPCGPGPCGPGLSAVRGLAALRGRPGGRRLAAPLASLAAAASVGACSDPGPEGAPLRTVSHPPQQAEGTAAQRWVPEQRRADDGDHDRYLGRCEDLTGKGMKHTRADRGAERGGPDSGSLPTHAPSGSPRCGACFIGVGADGGGWVLSRAYGHENPPVDGQRGRRRPTAEAGAFF
jgi:hypothetical protein